ARRRAAWTDRGGPIAVIGLPWHLLARIRRRADAGTARLDWRAASSPSPRRDGGWRGADDGHRCAIRARIQPCRARRADAQPRRGEGFQRGDDELALGPGDEPSARVDG